MIAIIAVNNLGFIGKDNKLMWRSSEDLQHFKSMTIGRIMLVGHNTFQTLPEVVKKRDIVVDGRWPYFPGINLWFEKGVCIGGKKTYEKYASQFTELHISHIDDNQIGDCTFPDFSNLNKDCKIFNYNFKVNVEKPKGISIENKTVQDKIRELEENKEGLIMFKGEFEELQNYNFLDVVFFKKKFFISKSRETFRSIVLPSSNKKWVEVELNNTKYIVAEILLNEERVEHGLKPL